MCTSYGEGGPFAYTRAAWLEPVGRDLRRIIAAFSTTTGVPMETRDPIFFVPDAAERPRRFSLRQIFLWTIIVALFCGLIVHYEQYPAAVVITWIGLGFVILMRLADKLRLVELLVVVALLASLVSIWVPAVTLPNTSARRAQCSNNLKQIALALHNYHHEHGSFPPAYIADENGKPMHSWRVLILPYLEQANVYDLYDFAEPWNGPNNRKLHSHVLSVYTCPAASPANAGNTNYLAIVGPDTAWPGEEARKLEEFFDGTSNTLLVVEVKDSGIHWMEPRDLEFETTSSLINTGPPGRCISSEHGHSASVAMADGSVHFLHQDTHGKTVQGLMTVNGGETVDLDDL